MGAGIQADENETLPFLSIAWTSSPKDSIDGKHGLAFGFQDMFVGTANPELANYTAQNNKTLKEAFDKRWMHSITTGAPWDVIKKNIAQNYNDADYKDQPWFIAGFRADAEAQDLASDLKDMQSAAKGGKFYGVSYSDFQHDYLAGTSTGLYSLGDTTIGSVKPCQTSVLDPTHPHCDNNYDVYCLAKGDEDRAKHVADAWGGNPLGHGACAPKDVRTSADGETILTETVIT